MNATILEGVIWPKGWTLVFPCGDTLEPTNVRLPIAGFAFKDHAEAYGKDKWPSCFETLTIGQSYGVYWLHSDGWFRLSPET